MTARMRKISLVKQYLMEEFGEQVREYGGFEESPPHSPDLTSIDFSSLG